jgi:hypothetical protein
MKIAFAMNTIGLAGGVRAIFEVAKLFNIFHVSESHHLIHSVAIISKILE